MIFVLQISYDKQHAENDTTNQKLNHQIALQKREYNDGYNEYDVRYDRNA